MIIGQHERRGLKFAKSFTGKKMFSFDWQENLPAKSQYEEISKRTLAALIEESPGFNIEISDGPCPLPDSFDFEGVVYFINVERK